MKRGGEAEGRRGRRHPLLALALIAGPLAAQDEASLKADFEGRVVAVRMDMPATDDGVDVYPAETPPVDFPRYQARVKKYGIAIRQGETAMVTKVKVKGKLIEFQLGGGGYGTAGDQTDASVGFAPAPKTEREKTLERDPRTCGIRWSSGAWKTNWIASARNASGRIGATARSPLKRRSAAASSSKTGDSPGARASTCDGATPYRRAH
jgi:hypothetical protein